MEAKRHKRLWRAGIISLCAVTWLAGEAYAAVPSFQGMGDLPGQGFQSVGLGVGIGGAPVATGWSESTIEREAFRWTAAGGMQGLGDLLGGTQWSEGRAVSADGRVIVGVSAAQLPQSYEEAFRWTAEEGMVGLGHLPNSQYTSSALAVNADGSVIVGTSSTPGGVEAFRWTADTGMVGLGDLPGGYVSSAACAVSADGAVVAGHGETDYGHAAFRWTESEGIVPLFQPPDPLDGTPYATASAASGTGGSLAGHYLVNAPSDFQAFRWTADGGAVDLDDAGGGVHFNKAWGISGDGQVIVGEGYHADGAVLWTAAGGVVRIKTLLENTYALDLTGWSLHSARAISADGTTIVGEGNGPHGEEAWIAVIPEPAGVLLFGLAGFILVGRSPARFAR